MARVLVQELKCPGHMLPYALDQALRHAEGGNEVIFALNGDLRSRLQTFWGEADLPPAFKLHWIDGIKTYLPGDGIRKSKSTARLEIDVCKQLIKEYNVDRVLLPSADNLGLRLIYDMRSARAIGANDLPWDLILHGSWAIPGLFRRRPDKKIMHTLTMNVVANPNTRMLTPDPFIAMGPGRRLLSRRLDRCCSFVPHPFAPFPHASKEEARAGLGLPLEDRLLVVLGAIDMRKAIDRLLMAMPTLSGVVDGVVLAGVIGPKCRALADPLLDSTDPKLYLLDRFLEPKSFGYAALAADLIWAVSPRWRGISSVQFLAGQCKRRCMVDRTHPSAVWCASFGEGCSVLDDSVQQTVQKALEGPPPDDKYLNIMAEFTSQDAQRAVLVDGVQVKSLETLERYAAVS